MTPAPVPTVDHASQWESIVDAYLSAFSSGLQDSALGVAAVFRARQMNADIPASLPVVAGGMVLQETYDRVIETVLSLQDHGEAYWLVDGDDFTVLQHDDVTVSWSVDGTTRLYTATNGSRYRTSGVAQNLEVLSVNRKPDMLEGVGWVQNGAIQGLLAQQAWATEYFQNNAAPTGVLEVPGNLTKEQAEQLLAQFIEGTTDGRRPRVLSGGMTWKSTSFNATDNEWTAGHLVGIGDVASLAGVPAYFLSYSPAGTSLVYSSTSELWRMYWAETLEPTYISRIEQAWSRVLNLPVKFDPEQLLIASLQERSQAASVLVAAGYDPVAVADVVGLPPMGVITVEASTDVV